MEWTDSIASMDNVSRTSIFVVGAEKVSKIKNTDRVYQLGCFCCIINLLYRVLSFVMFLVKLIK